MFNIIGNLGLFVRISANSWSLVKEGLSLAIGDIYPEMPLHNAQCSSLFSNHNLSLIFSQRQAMQVIILWLQHRLKNTCDKSSMVSHLKWLLHWVEQSQLCKSHKTGDKAVKSKKV